MRAPAKPRLPARAPAPAPPVAEPAPRRRLPSLRRDRAGRARTADGGPVTVRELRSASGRVSRQLGERLAERRRAIRRLRMRTVAWLAGAVVVLAALGWVVWWSPVLALDLEDVEITGTTAIVSEVEVRELVAAHAGEPLARVDTGGLRDRVESIAGVREAVVTRAWPTGLSVAIEPRVPVANVTVDGGYALLDADGVELLRSEAPAEGVPVVGVPVGAADTAQSLEAVLTVMSALPEDLRTQVADASAATPYQVRFRLTSGAEVVWGSAEENELKVAVLGTLLATPADVYDISAPRSPITK